MAKAANKTGEKTSKSKPTKSGPATSAADKKRGKALDAALQQIEKNYGAGRIMKLAGDQLAGIKGIPTGALSLDIALGGQGMPKGRICELYGPEGSGKTTLALHIIACAQKEDGVAAFQ